MSADVSRGIAPSRVVVLALLALAFAGGAYAAGTYNAQREAAKSTLLTEMKYIATLQSCLRFERPGSDRSSAQDALNRWSKALDDGFDTAVRGTCSTCSCTHSLAWTPGCFATLDVTCIDKTDSSSSRARLTMVYDPSDHDWVIIEATDNPPVPPQNRVGKAVNAVKNVVRDVKGAFK